MLKNRRAFRAVLFVFGIAMLYPYAKGMAESKNSDALENEPAIQFGDPAHVFFFNHQDYLAQHKLSGETPETWGSLPSPERLKKVKDGEALLEKLHADLVAKQIRTPDEESLFEAVWGKSGATGDRAIARQVDAAEKRAATSPAVDKVNAISGNWSRLFDGGRNSAQDVGVVSAGSGQHGETSVETRPKAPVMKSLDAASVPPIDNGDNSGPFKHPLLPLAAGAVVIAGACYVMRKETAPAESPSKVQIDAVNDLIGNPERRAEFMKDPAAYAAKNNISFDPAVVKMAQAAIVKHEQEIARLGSDNPYRSGIAGPTVVGAVAGTVIGGSSTVDRPIVAGGAVVTTSTVVEGPLPGGGACVVATK
jgi:hypothetical protein